MKTKHKKEKKSVIQELREIRDKISLEIKDLSFEDLVKYFNRQKSLYPSNIWRKQVE
jgi:hypothetical protein